MLSFEIPVHQKLTEGINNKANAKFLRDTRFEALKSSNIFHEAFATIKEIINVAAKQLLKVIRDKKNDILQINQALASLYIHPGGNPIV